MQDYRYKRGLEYIRACAALSKNQPPKELDLLVDYDRMCESLRTNFPDDKITAGGIEYDIKYLDDAVKFSAKEKEPQYIDRWRWEI